MYLWFVLCGRCGVLFLCLCFRGENGYLPFSYWIYLFSVYLLLGLSACVLHVAVLRVSFEVLVFCGSSLCDCWATLSLANDLPGVLSL